MFRKITIALLASTLIAAPVLAQSTRSAGPAPATQPVTTTAAKPTVNAAKPAMAKAVKATKVKKHKVKKVKIVKQAKHAKHIKHAPDGKRVFHATTKQTMPSPTN